MTPHHGGNLLQRARVIVPLVGLVGKFSISTFCPRRHRGLDGRAVTAKPSSGRHTTGTGRPWANTTLGNKLT